MIVLTKSFLKWIFDKNKRFIFRACKIQTSNAQKDILKSFGGITVNNALMPKAGSSQINFNFDSRGNLFGFYGYSLRNIFQLELLNIGSFDALKHGGDGNSNLYSTYLNENNWVFEKRDSFWKFVFMDCGI